jgi:hypothetical protein
MVAAEVNVDRQSIYGNARILADKNKVLGL